MACAFASALAFGRVYAGLGRGSSQDRGGEHAEGFGRTRTTVGKSGAWKCSDRAWPAVLASAAEGPGRSTGVTVTAEQGLGALQPVLLDAAGPLDAPGLHGRYPLSRATRAWPTSAVEAAPPRSAVRTRPSSQNASIARSTRSASTAWPRWRRRSAADQTAPIGLARPWPAMSGAE